MNDTLVTIILLAIGTSALWLGYWVVERVGTDARGRNSCTDPNSPGADSREIVLTSRDK